MRVLIAAKHPPNGAMPIGGVQTWSKTVGTELSLRGHTVEYWGPELARPEGRFDAGIFANWKHTAAAAEQCSRLLRVSHGIIPDESVGDVATSEEVADRWKITGGIIRQPIDLEFWTPSDCPKTLFTRFSYRGGLTWIREAIPRGLEYVHLKSAKPAECREVLQRSAIVVATGRAALEAMTCGACVVIADAREYQAALVDFNAAGSMSRNYSGRGGVRATPESLEIAVERALDVGPLLNHVWEHHDAKRIVDDIERRLA